MRSPRNLFRSALIGVAALLCQQMAQASNLNEQRTTVQTLDTPRTFPEIHSRTQWEIRARVIRQQILVSCGLWPLPDKTPLNSRIFDRVVRDGYSIEKVYFESFPGVFVAGNLYRPLDKGPGPFPAILNPHGHWENGRMADIPDGSIAARCINFASQGMIAFSYDMVGYNDTFFPDQGLPPTTANFYERHRRFATNPTNLLWNINLMGLQTWNSIRALDFLESLPDVDKRRLACTGESGGGTQTYVLGALDERLAAQAPVAMVSHTMQGGCACENAPGLRIHFSNMEIAASAAPRPQIMVGATGDWTRDTQKVEGPAIAQIYKLFGAEDQFRFPTFNAPHNYNRTSREAVYDFFGTTLKPVHPVRTEVSYTKEADNDLRVFADNNLPAHAKTEAEFISYLVLQSRARLDALKPVDRKTFTAFKETMLPAWQRTFLMDEPAKPLLDQPVYLRTITNYTQEKIFIGRRDRGDRIPALLFTPVKKTHRWTALLVHPRGKSAFMGQDSAPAGLARELLARNVSVLLIDPFMTGEARDAEAAKTRNKQADLFFTTYNLTDAQARVQDIVTAASFARKNRRGTQVVVCGLEQAGLWALMAAPAVDAVVADANQLNTAADEEFLSPNLFVPGILKLGSFDTMASLAAPNPLFLHNTGTRFATNYIADTYRVVPRSSFTAMQEAAPIERLANWITALK